MLRGALANLRVGEVVDAAVQLDVLGDRQVLVQGEPLAHVADVALDDLALGEDVAADDARLPAARRQQPGQHPDRRRLAGAVGAEESEDFAFAHVERDAIDGDERRRTAA